MSERNRRFGLGVPQSLELFKIDKATQATLAAMAALALRAREASESAAARGVETTLIAIDRSKSVTETVVGKGAVGFTVISEVYGGIKGLLGGEEPVLGDRPEAKEE